MKVGRNNEVIPRFYKEDIKTGGKSTARLNCVLVKLNFQLETYIIASSHLKRAMYHPFLDQIDIRTHLRFSHYQRNLLASKMLEIGLQTKLAGNKFRIHTFLTNQK